MPLFASRVAPPSAQTVRSVVRLWTGLSLVVANLTLALPAQAACKLRMAWREEPPYFMKGSDGKPQGLLIDMARAALQRMSCELELVEMPWQRAQVEVQAGRVDLLGGVIRRPEREAFLWFSQPSFTTRVLVFVRVDAAHARRRLNRPEDLLESGMSIGVEKGDAFRPEFEAALQRLEALDASRVQRVAHYMTLFQMMRHGRLDALAADEMSARYLIRKEGLQALVERTDLVASHESWSFAFGKASVARGLVDRFDQALQEMRRSGALDAMVNSRLGAP